CTATASASVIASDDIPTAAATVSEMLGCANATVTVSGQGSSADCVTYLWTTTDGHIVSGDTSLNAIVDQAGTYTLTVPSTFSGNTATATVIVELAPEVSVVFVSKEDVDCFGNATGSITVSETGGTAPFTYLWSNGATTATITGLVAGAYSVTVTDDNGCTSELIVMIIQPPLLVANVTVTHESSPGANDGSAISMPTGGNPPYEWLWSNGSTANGIMNLAPGVYSLTLTDEAGCDDVVTVVINPADCATSTLAVSVTSTNESAPGANDGTATATPSGGVAPFTYDWSNGATTAAITNLAPGTYTVVVTDAEGCGVVGTATIEAFEVDCDGTLTVSIASTNESSAGANDGTATATPSGGTAPYSYAWSNGATTASITNLSPGTYTVTVTDAEGCTVVGTATILEFGCDGSLAVSITSTNESAAGANDGTATATASGGTAPYSYAWSNGATTASISNLTPGTYTVTVTDAEGCTVSGSVTIEPFTGGGCNLEGEITSVNIGCPGSEAGSAEVSVSGGSGNY
ncbi:MAG: SprB repeat-containing protein, partial [Planctomycetota bacterium]